MNEMTQAEFARYKGVSKALVTRWKQEGRLVMTADGKRILVNESNQKLKDTSSPSGYLNSIHAAEKRKSKGADVQEDEFTELKESVKDVQLDLETKNADELLKNARALREKAAALQLSAEHEKFIGSLVEREQVEKLIFERGRQFRDGLVSMSRRIAPQIAGNTDISEIEKIIANEVRSTLEDFCKLPQLQ